MAEPRHFVGLDLAAEQFHAALGVCPWRLQIPATEFRNDPAGFQAFLTWLAHAGCTPADTMLCMEATGVYGEALAYGLVAAGYRVALEPPLAVKRAFKPFGPKTDAVDCQQIAEYACRYLDQLHVWQPRADLLEHLQVLLTTREQLVKQRTALKNSLHALERKVVRTEVAEAAHRRLIVELDQQIQSLEREMARLFKQDPPAQHLLGLLLTIPGVGLLLAAQYLVLTQCGTRLTDPKTLAAHVGIAPLPYESGTSVWRPARSRHFGPAGIRKLLHLAARSVCTHKEPYRRYYHRKLAEGKPKKLVLNNVANKLLKVMSAVVHSQQPYQPDYAA